MTLIPWLAKPGYKPEVLELVSGCAAPVSRGCENCWGERQANGRLRRFYPHGFRHVSLRPDQLDKPDHWHQPRMVFMCSRSDLFQPWVPFEYLEAVIEMINRNPQHIFISLTKRSERMGKFALTRTGDWPRNWWAGISIEDQGTLEERIWDLYAVEVQAEIVLISAEPLLGPVNLEEVLVKHGAIQPLHWLITGGESGAGARPMHPYWPRDLHHVCADFGIPFFFKQWGEFAPRLLFPELSCAGNDVWGTLDRTGEWSPMTTPWNGIQGEQSESGEYVMIRHRVPPLIDGEMEVKEWPDWR